MAFYFKKTNNRSFKGVFNLFSMRESVFYCVTTLLKYLNDYLSLFLIDNYQVLFFCC